MKKKTTPDETKKQLEGLEDEWDEWRQKVKGSKLHRVLGDEQPDVKPYRGEDASKRLAFLIEVYCFCCSDFKRIPESDWSIELRNEDRWSLEPTELKKKYFAHWRQHGALLYPTHKRN